MGRATIILNTPANKAKATEWIAKAPPETRVEFKRSKRTLPQNDLMWARLTEIAEQVVWYGQKLGPEDWKDVFTASLRKARVVPGIDPGTYVPTGMRTSDMDKEEMGHLLDLIDAFAAQQGVVFTEREAA